MEPRTIQTDVRPKAYRKVSINLTLFLLLLLFYIVPGVQAVQPVKAQVPHDDLFSVSFPTENDGWAAGRWGTVLHTADGGRTWTRQETGTDFTLTSVSFPDVRNGWAVGDEGTVIHTADGGKTWEKQKSPVSFFLMGVHFADARKGWIVTERTHILYTDDGGKTWRVQFKDDDFILKAVSFCDSLNGWAVGEYGFVYHTKDGGKNWVKEAGGLTVSDLTGVIEAGDQLFGVTAVSPQVAWAVGIDGYVTRTLDGGKTWAKVNLPIPKTQLFCVTLSKAGTIAIGGKRAFIWSTDRGVTWKTPEFKPPVTYGWFYGLTRRGGSGFVAVGSEGAIYLNNGDKTSASWQRADY